jgi:hypothetical protein
MRHSGVQGTPALLIVLQALRFAPARVTAAALESGQGLTEERVIELAGQVKPDP